MTTAPVLPATARQRRWRERQRRGKLVAAVELDARVIAALVRAGYLTARNASDPVAIGAALGRAAAAWSRIL